MQAHWIYALGSPETLAEASSWRDRKSTQGKDYRLIDATSSLEPSGRLIPVGPEDVLYIFSKEAYGSPNELAVRLKKEGLPRDHASLKLFASNTGTPQENGRCYAQELYEVLKRDFPRITVYGYIGEVSPQGFDLHKTAGLGSGEQLDAISEGEWKNRGLRAQNNRVIFPSTAANIS